MDKQVETIFDKLNDLHTTALEEGATNDQFLTALEMIRDIVADEIPDDDDDEQDGEPDGI